MKGVNKVGRNLALPKNSWQFSKCHCLCSLPSAPDLRLFCFQPESVPFLASLFPAVARHRAISLTVLDCEHMSGLEEWWGVLEKILLPGQTRQRVKMGVRKQKSREQRPKESR